ncbi:MAG TPA: hypothetical protein VKH37_06925 [Ferruginibacter sp.]|nr:hypothetical protein [Ferruginibacter sp.]
MKKFGCAAFIAAALLVGCGGKTASSDQSTPKAAAEMVFNAAKSGDFSQLKNLCDPSLDNDGDSKKVCNVANQSADDKEGFRKVFKNGKVNGDPVIEGDQAKVDILFGENGTDKETFNMQKKDGKWYLVSF